MKRWFATLVLVALALPLVATSTQAQPRQMRIARNHGTVAPAFVTGITDAIRPGGPQAAARAYLAANDAIYGIGASEGDLRVVEQIHSPSSTTVRFGQNVAGIPVVGAQYLVHMSRSRAGHSVSSVNGHYFTALEDPGPPTLETSTAEMLARTFVRPMRVLLVQRHGLALLPRGPGQLTHHFTLWGERLGARASHEIFVDAHTGALAGTVGALRYDGPVVGSGVDAHGATVDLNVFQRGSSYELRDRARAMFATDRGEITTHDVSGSHGFDATRDNIVQSSNRRFSGEATSSGAVDAHWGAGQTYEFFRALGRNSIDDRGMSIVSSVDANDPDFGGPMYNAFWDEVANQMVYGNPNRQQLYPISADLDIVGHELTHGVIQYSADLLYLYQSGAMNEAYADYFGNAIDVSVSGTEMTDPKAGHVGEDICKVPVPENWECPLRDLNDNATIADFGYYLPDLDSGGVHLNSNIFAGALWDIREALGPVADTYIYKALAEYQTPLDDFVDGRNAVLQAARQLNASASDIEAIGAAFVAKGIVAGWENAGEIDSTVLARDVTAVTELCPISGGQPRVAGRRFVYADYASDAHICERSATIYAGSLGGDGRVKVGGGGSLLAAPNGAPDIAGSRVVWSRGRALTHRRFDIDVRAKVLGGRSSTVAGGPGLQWFPAIHGKLLAWENSTGRTGTDIKARTISGKTFTVASRRSEEWLPQVAGRWIAWWEQGGGPATIRAKNVRTGETMVVRAPAGTKFVGPPSLSKSHIVWYQDEDLDGTGEIMAIPLGGNRVTTLVGSNGSAPPFWDPMSFFFPVPAVNGSHVVYESMQRSGATEFGRDLFIVPLSGGPPVPVTENRGDQAYPALGAGRRTLWLDASLGRADLMTRVVP